MQRTLLSAAALTALLCLSARGAESDHWDLETGSPVKVVNFLAGQNGEIFALTHSGKIYRRTPPANLGDAPGWSLVFDGLPGGTGGDPEHNGRYSRSKGGFDPAAGWTNTDLPTGKVTPAFVLFNGKFYLSGCYYVKYRSIGGKVGYYEMSVFEIDPANGYRSSAVLQIRHGPLGNAGAYYRGRAMGGIIDGYMFKDTDLYGPGGSTLYWGGGGRGKMISPPHNGYGEAAWNNAWNGTNEWKAGCVFKTTNGTDWSPVGADGRGRRSSDQYRRNLWRNMPNGYRYNHLVEFAGKFWDYYGYYDKNTGTTFADVQAAGTGKKCTAFTFHAKVKGSIPGLDGTHHVHTEPWSRFGMAAGNVRGDRLIRVGFTPKGDRNFLCSITGTGGSWSDFYDSNGGNAWNGPDHNGVVYWRYCCVLDGNLDDTGGDSGSAGSKYNEALHNGLYATYSKKTGAASYESGVFRYSHVDTNGDDLVDDWRWVKAAVDTADARVYTGAMFAQPNDREHPTRGVILVSTSAGVRGRGIGQYGKGPDATADTADDVNPMPTN